MIFCFKDFRNLIRSKKGFSLIELSIVIIVLSLLIGGVITGAALIERAKLQNVLQEFRQISFAVSNFRLQYGSLPGDLQTGSTVLSGAAGCDGSGVGVIVADGTSISPTCAWVHLNAAGTLSGGLSGDYPTVGGTGYYSNSDASNLPVLGINIPASKWSGSGFMFRSFLSDAYTYVVLGKPSTQSDIAPAFTSKQANSITKKVGPGAGAEGATLIAINADNNNGTGTTGHECHDAAGAYKNLTDATMIGCAFAQQILD